MAVLQTCVVKISIHFNRGTNVKNKKGLNLAFLVMLRNFCKVSSTKLEFQEPNGYRFIKIMIKYQTFQENKSKIE